MALAGERRVRAGGADQALEGLEVQWWKGRRFVAST